MSLFLGSNVEWSVKPFAARERVLQRYINTPPPEDPDAEAQICWGGQSTFGFKKGQFGIAPPVTITYPEPDPEDAEDLEDEVTLDFTEIPDLRQETEVRVENPDDSEQYVMVKNVDVIVFEGPDLRPDEMIGREGRQAKIYYRYTLTTPED